MSILCFFCKKPVDPSARSTSRQMVGWEHKSLKTSSRRGGSDIQMREPTGEFAHETCISLVKRGINPEQGSLL